MERMFGEQASSGGRRTKLPLHREAELRREFWRRSSINTFNPNQNRNQYRFLSKADNSNYGRE